VSQNLWNLQNSDNNAEARAVSQPTPALSFPSFRKARRHMRSRSTGKTDSRNFTARNGQVLLRHAASALVVRCGRSLCSSSSMRLPRAASM